MQPGLDQAHGNSFRPPVPPPVPAEDFLGLGAELGRAYPAGTTREPTWVTPHMPPVPQARAGQFQQPLPPSAFVRAPMPPQELLAPTQRLAGNWPEVRPNTWRVGRDAAPAAPAERPSWLLELDDASIPPAHPSFIATTAPANASFRDGTEVAHRVAPWFVRALCVFAGLFLCAVITRTILLRAAHPPAAPEAPVQPIARAVHSAGQELLAPGDAGAATRAKPGQRPPKSAPKKAYTNSTPAALSAAPSNAGSESPALFVYDLPAAASAQPAAGQELSRADAERWLAEQSRASAPLSDAGAIRAGEPSLPGTATPTAASAAGIWEGATIPVEALSGGLRLQTPGVGRVRVRLEGGARAEGKLTAIGQGRVWIETDDGPLEVESARMRGLEQIAERSVASGPQAPKRQRVRTDGGVFYGRVLARDGRTVTLITDAGARVTVEADEVADADPAEAK